MFAEISTFKQQGSSLQTAIYNVQTGSPNFYASPKHIDINLLVNENHYTITIIIAQLEESPYTPENTSTAADDFTMSATSSNRGPTNDNIAQMSSTLRELKQMLNDEDAQIIHGTSSSSANSDLNVSTLEATPEQTTTESSTPTLEVGQDMPKVQDEVQAQSTSQEVTEDSASVTENESDVSDVSGVTLPIPVDQDSVEENPSKSPPVDYPMHALIRHRGGPIKADVARLREMLEKVEGALEEHGMSSDMSNNEDSITAHHVYIKQHLGGIYENLKNMALICVESQAEVSLQLSTNLQCQMQDKAVEIAAVHSTSSASTGYEPFNDTAALDDESKEETTTPYSTDQLVKNALEKLDDVQAADVKLNESASDKIAGIESDLRSIQLEKSMIDRKLDWKDLQIQALEMAGIENIRKKVDAQRKLVEQVREFQVLQLEKMREKHRFSENVLEWEHRLKMQEIDGKYRLLVEKAKWEQSLDLEKSERKRDLLEHRIVYVLLLFGSIWGESLIGWLMKIF